MPSRRVLLRAVGAGVLASIAGCSGGGQTDFEAPTETTAASEYQETTIMSSKSTTTASAEVSTTSTAGRASSAETTAITETTPGETQETAEETTATTEDESSSQSNPSNGGSGSPSGGNGSPEDPETTESTPTEPTETDTTTPSDPKSTTTASTTTETTTTETTTTERPPTTTTTTETTTTDQPPTTTTRTTTTTEQPPTTTTETTTADQPPTTTTPEEPPTTTTTERPPSEAGSWSAGADLPAPQSNAGGGVVDGSLYCFGGIESGENLPAVARTYRFDPADGSDGTWHRLEDMPRALWAPCGVAVDGKLYSFGGAPTNAPYGTGESPSDEIFVYTPGEGWRDLTAETGVRCPYPNWAMGGVYDPADELVYLVGGGTDVTDRESASDHGVGTGDPGTYDESRIWTFDPSTEEVANPDLARLPEARRWPTVALVEVDGETCLHAICGLFGVTGPTNDNLRYRVSTGEWASMTPAPRSGCYATNSDPVIDGTLYLTHGFFWEDSPSVDSYDAACHAYDPAADSFRTDLSSPSQLRGGAVDAVVGDTLYVVGGHVKRYDRNGYHDCKVATEAFTPSG